MRRGGFSLVEIVVVCLASTVVLAALVGLWTGGTKMSKAAQSSVALQNALILEENLLLDLHQMGVNPSQSETHLVSNRCLSFFKVVFVGAEIALRPVKYSRVSSPGGLSLLARSEATAGGGVATKVFGSMPLHVLRFSQFEDGPLRNRYLRVDLQTADEDRPIAVAQSAALMDRKVSRTLIVRVPDPAMLDSPIIAPVARINPIPGTRLFPLDP